MDLGLGGKTAIVTGASRGIGLAIARALHREGVAQVIVGRRHETLHEAARTISKERGESGAAQGAAAVHPIVADLGMRAEVERVVAQSIARLGHVDILVNNAGQSRSGSFFEMPEEAFEAVWQVKAFGYTRMVAALAPHMRERRSGSIINIIGTAARTPTEDFIIGSMVNAALLNFTRGVARILAHDNVRVNAISPGWTLTEGQLRHFEMQAAARGESLDDVQRKEARAIPLGRLVTMEEIAEMALLLASDRLPAMTGEDVIIDGGATPSI
jgi:NAD(P)-dependent dehydrogenase (short-subunit alcohol dehydrogenase family)